jgi:hypothetical protein
MTSKLEIKTAFTAELRNTEEYQIVLKIKEKILNDIATPNIQEKVNYYFETKQNEEQRNNIKLCMIIEFGFYSNEINEDCIVVDMKFFLN